MRLRYIELRDTQRLVDWRNANAEFFPPQEPWTYSSHYRWYCKYLTDNSDFVHMVCLDDGTPVGTIGVTSKGHMAGHGVYEIGRVLLGRRDIAPAGIMSEALQAVMKQHEGDIYCLKVLLGNARAIRFYEKNGFSEYSRDDEFAWMTKDMCDDPSV